MGIQFTHISTDHLYDGSKSFYNEENITNPINIYGQSKLDGEVRVQNENPEALIIRTNFYGLGNIKKYSFSDWIINSLRSGKSINVFNDIFYTPIIIDELVRCVEILWEKKSKGIFNVVGSERLSKYEFALKSAQVFNLNNKLINKSTINDSNFIASRPKDMSLSNKKLLKTISYKPMTIESSLNELYFQEKKGRNKIINDAFI